MNSHCWPEINNQTAIPGSWIAGLVPNPRFRPISTGVLYISPLNHAERLFDTFTRLLIRY